MPLKSVLKLGIDALSDTAKIKGQSLPGVFKKMGVKEEELKFSGIDIDPKKTFTKTELQELEASRTDVFGQTEPADTSYDWVSLPAGVSNPTYKEKVYTFKEGTGDVSRYTSEHYPDVPNYLMHTRVYDDTIEGKPTRVLQEIQSDLHQQAREQGGFGTGTTTTLSDDQVRTIHTRLNEAESNPSNLARVREELMVELNIEDEVMLDTIHTLGEGAVGRPWETRLRAIPSTPYTRSWLAKGIEREVMSAVQEGRQQIAIPITGEGVEQLNRSEGVQKWYETQVVNTARKIAKQQGMDFELKGGSAKVLGKLSDAQQKGIKETYSTISLTEGLGSAWEGGINALVKELGGTDIDYPSLLGAILKGENVSSHLSGAEGTKYALIKPELQKLKAKFNVVGQESAVAQQGGFKLYSTPAAAVGAAYIAVKNKQDPRAELAEQGFEKAEIDEIMMDVDGLNRAVSDGHSFTDAMTFLQNKEAQIDSVESVEEPFVWPWTRTPERDRAMEIITGSKSPDNLAFFEVTSDKKLSAQELLTHLEVIQPNMASIATRISGATNNSIDFDKARALETSSAQRILDLAKEKGVNLLWQPATDPGVLEQLVGAGKFYLQTPEGPQELTSGIWQSIKAEKGEILGAVTGGVVGAKYGVSLAARAGIKHPAGVGAAGFIGSLIGAAGGAIGGTELDYLESSIILQENLSAQIAARKALTAGEASVIGDFVGFNLAKVGGTFWNGVMQAKNLLIDGNTQGAKKAIKNMMFMSDDEVTDMVSGLRKATQDDLITDTKSVVDFEGVEQVINIPTVSRLSEEEEAIRSMILTQPGGEGILRAASTIDPQAGRAVAKVIDDRAKDVLKSTANLTDENVGRILKDDLTNYTGDVKKFYGDVKEQVAISPNINKFEFNYDKLAINPIMEELEKNITDPTVLDRFILQSKRVKSMSDSRTLADLIELRQLVNDFKFNKRISKTKDFNTLNKVISDIDGAIRQGASVVMEHPNKWLSDFTLAKTQYAKMKGLERNVIARALGRPGITEDTVVKSLTKYINSIDGTFQDVMSKLPKKTRALTEGAVVNNLANKFTAGAEGGFNVIHFPLLAKELDKVAFTTPEARKSKAAIQRMAEVFRNDIALAESTGHIQVPKFQSFLTADPVIRAKFEFASSVFNRIKQLAPTKAGANIAVVMRAAELLEKPLNAKLMKEVMEEVADDINLSKQLVEIQTEAVRASSIGKDPTAARVNVFGTGNIQSLKGKGKSANQIAIHRIATYSIRKQIADTYSIDISDTKRLDRYLINEGYVATQQGTSKVRRLK